MILVTGATGTVGCQVVRQLAGLGHRVRAVTRNPAAASFPDGTEVAEGDLTEPASLAPHVQEAEGVFLLWPFLSPGLASDLAPQVAGVLDGPARRVVYLSAQPAAEDPGSLWAIVEDSIRRTRVDWTFLRAAGFAKNTLIWAPQIRAGDVVRWPFGQAARALIHEADIAAAAVAALTQDGHSHQAYTLTGPAVLTQAEQVRVIGEVLRRPLRWEEMPPGEAREYLTGMFGDATFAARSLRTWAGFVTEPEAVTAAVQQITGHPAGTFRQWVTEHATGFR